MNSANIIQKQFIKFNYKQLSTFQIQNNDRQCQFSASQMSYCPIKMLLKFEGTNSCTQKNIIFDIFSIFDRKQNRLLTYHEQSFAIIARVIFYIRTILFMKGARSLSEVIIIRQAHTTDLIYTRLSLAYDKDCDGQIGIGTVACVSAYRYTYMCRSTQEITQHVPKQDREGY